MPDGTVCNPALLHTVPTGRLLGQLYIGNGYAAMSTANNLIFKPISQEFLRELFEKQNVTSLEFSAGLSFTGKHFAASLMPYRIQYLSEIHNPNLPVVAVHAALERSMTVSTGSSLGFLSPRLRELGAGMNVRIIDRSFIHSSFNLSQVATSPDPRMLVPVIGQNAVLIDPAVSWTPSRAPWKLRTSVGARNLGWTWPEVPLYSEEADLQAGVGVEPPLGFGRLKLGLDLIDMIHAEDLVSRFRVGTSYQFGMLELMSGVNAKSLSGGMQFTYDLFQAGIVYEFIRSDVEGGNPENRIATEFAVRL
jgi:hypothetical protein